MSVVSSVDDKMACYHLNIQNVTPESSVNPELLNEPCLLPDQILI